MRRDGARARGRTRALVATLVATFVACTPDAPPDTYSWEEYFSDYETVFCAKLEECEGFEEVTEISVEECPAYFDEESDPCVTYQPDAAEICVADFEAASCEQLEDVGVPSCADVCPSTAPAEG